jgi:threonine dehydrogenase-like Zn-dependent dehydrogenase
MKIAILHGPRDLRIENHPLNTDALGPNQIWVETEITALKIGTDRGNYEGAEQVPGAPNYPRWVGDSNFGIVRATGTAVTRFSPGDRVVALKPHQSEYIACESDHLVKVPAGIEPEDAVFAHLYALSAHCYHKALFRPGERVAVVGIGVLGLGAIALGPLFGARVVALANSAIRLEMAGKMGAHAGFLSDDPNLDEKLDSFSNGHGIDLVILTANPWPALRTSMQIVRPNGRVSIVSLVGRGESPPDFNPLKMELFYAKGISLIAISGPAGSNYPCAGPVTGTAEDSFSGDCTAVHMLALMADGNLEPKRLVTHRFHYTEIAEAYEMGYKREKSMLGVVFDWRK